MSADPKYLLSEWPVLLALLAGWAVAVLFPPSLIAQESASAHHETGQQRTVQAPDRTTGPAGPVAEVPQHARDLFKVLQERDGAPLPGYVGGRVFHNRERRLPRGRYREYDVHPRQRSRPRGGERIVIEQRTQKAYYTPDHYHTFLPLN